MPRSCAWHSWHEWQGCAHRRTSRGGCLTSYQGGSSRPGQSHLQALCVNLIPYKKVPMPPYRGTSSVPGLKPPPTCIWIHPFVSGRVPRKSARHLLQRLKKQFGIVGVCTISSIQPTCWSSIRGLLCDLLSSCRTTWMIRPCRPGLSGCWRNWRRNTPSGGVGR